MEDPGRHELYLRGFLSEAEQERYEEAVSSQPLLAAELRSRLSDGTDWDPEMSSRAGGLLAVVEAFAGGWRRSPVRIDLLPAAPFASAVSEGPRVAEDTKVVDIVNTILVTALTSGADQIEILPGDEAVNVWVDSAVERRPLLQLPSNVHLPLMARIRVMSGLDSDDVTLPQSGRIELHHNGRNYDVEVTFEPTSRGEAVTLTLVDRG